MPWRQERKKVKFSLFTPCRLIRRLKVYVHSFLVSQLGRGERLTSRLCWFTPGEEPRRPFNRRLSGLQSRSEQCFKSSLTVKCEKNWRSWEQSKNYVSELGWISLPTTEWTEWLAVLGFDPRSSPHYAGLPSSDQVTLQPNSVFLFTKAPWTCPVMYIDLS
jgi:hypothetical protein